MVHPFLLMTAGVRNLGHGGPSGFFIGPHSLTLTPNPWPVRPPDRGSILVCFTALGLILFAPGSERAERKLLPQDSHTRLKFAENVCKCRGYSMVKQKHLHENVLLLLGVFCVWRANGG